MDSVHGTDLAEGVAGVLDRGEGEDYNSLMDVANNFSNGFLHVNIQSLRKHWEEFLMLVSHVRHGVQVIVVTEVNLHSSMIASFYLTGFQKFYVLRERTVARGGPGGGIVVFCRDNLVVSEIAPRNVSSFECILLEVKEIDSNFKCILLSIYRPPDGNLREFLSELETLVGSVGREDNLILLGDINIDLLKCTKFRDEYLAIMSGEGLATGITGVTREAISAGRLTKSCIDHIFFRLPLHCYVSSRITRVRIADHFITSLHYGKKAVGCLDIKKQEVKEFVCHEKMIKALAEVNWREVLEWNDPVDVYEFIIQEYERARARSVCNKSPKRNRENKEWMTPKLIDDTCFRDVLFKKWKSDPENVVNEKNYKVFRNRLNRRLRKARDDFYKEKFRSLCGNIPEVWKNVNLILGRPCKGSIDEIATRHFAGLDSQILASKFADSFLEELQKDQHLGCGLSLFDSHLFDSVPDDGNFLDAFRPITWASVALYLDKTSSAKSPGIDGVHIKYIENVPEMWHAIVKLLNLILDLGVMPDRFKESVIRPVFKKGSKSKVCNYRPIALLPLFEKILENHINICMRDYLNNSHFFTTSQYGFREGMGAETCLKHFSDHINKQLSEKKQVLVVFVDLVKAFDNVNHSTLLAALKSAGIRGKCLRFFEVYLSDRRMRVKINKKFGKIFGFSTGVAQGSILGPLLFLVYLNGIGRSILFGKLFLFADDIALVVSHTSYEVAYEMLVKDFVRMQKWLHDMGVCVNAGKSKCMHIRSPYFERVEFSLKVHTCECLADNSGLVFSDSCKCEKTLECVSQFKYLGVWIDDRFKWDVHSNYVSSRLRSCLFGFSLLRRVSPNSVLRSVYFALVDSILRYGLLTWGSAAQCHRQNVINVQDRIVKLFSQNRREVYNRWGGYSFLRALPLDRLYVFKIVMEYYYEDSYRRQPPRVRSTRSNSDIRYLVPFSLNSYGEALPEVVVPVVFNNLPLSLKVLPMLPKNMLKKYVKEVLIQEEIGDAV